MEIILSINSLNYSLVISRNYKICTWTDGYEYPTPALREIILNALVHRNYMGSPTQIRVYDNKINFWNEGTLPEGLTFEALKGFHTSRPRNVLIADVCFKGGFIDSWGRGTLKIYDACKEAELPEPEIKEFQGGFLVTLFKDNLTEDQLAKLGLNDRQLKAVNFVREKVKITNKEYQELNETSDRTALRDLGNLTELNIFVKDGKKKGTSYKLKSGG